MTDDPRKNLESVPTAKTSSIWETSSDASKREARDLAKLWAAEPEYISRRGWTVVAGIYGKRWNRPRLSGPSLKALLERLLNETEKDSRTKRRAPRSKGGG